MHGSRAAPIVQINRTTFRNYIPDTTEIVCRHERQSGPPAIKSSRRPAIKHSRLTGSTVGLHTVGLLRKKLYEILSKRIGGSI